MVPKKKLLANLHKIFMQFYGLLSVIKSPIIYLH